MSTSAGRDWTALVLALQNKDKKIKELRAEVATVQESLISRNDCINYLHGELTRLVICLKEATNIKNSAVEIVGSDEMDISAMLNLSGDLFQQITQKRFEQKFAETFEIMKTLIDKSTDMDNGLAPALEALEYSHQLVYKLLNKRTNDPEQAANEKEKNDSAEMMNVVEMVEVSLNVEDVQVQEWEATAPYIDSGEITDQVQSDTTRKSTGGNECSSNEENDTTQMENEISSIPNENGYTPNKETDSAQTGIETGNMEQSSSIIQSDHGGDGESSDVFSKPTKHHKLFYYCQVCGKTYRSQGGLKLHIVSKHSSNKPTGSTKAKKRRGRSRKRIAAKKTLQPTIFSDKASSSQDESGLNSLVGDEHVIVDVVN